MEWYELADNPEGIFKIYGKPPSLDNVHIHELVLNRIGPKLEIWLDLSEYPADPPTKWKHAGFNKVQVVLMLFPLIEVKVDGWTTDNLVDITVSKEEGGRIKVVYNKNSNCSLYVICGGLIISSISSYLEIKE